MQDGPDTHFWRGGGHGQRTGSEIKGNFCAEYGHDHLYHKIEGYDPCKQNPQDQEQATDNLSDRNPMGGCFWRGEARTVSLNLPTPWIWGVYEFFSMPSQKKTPPAIRRAVSGYWKRPVTAVDGAAR